MRFCFWMMGCSVLAAAVLSAAGLEEPASQATWVVRADRRTGRLVRAIVTPGQGARPRQTTRFDELVQQAAKQHQLDPFLVHSVIQAESNYNPFALSPKGAEGIMQLMPSTARRFGVANSFNAAENIQGGARYLRYLLDLFRNERLAVAAYNAGEEAVIRHGGVPPYRETRNYVQVVSRAYSNAKRGTTMVAAVKQEASKPAEPVYRPLEAFRDEQGVVHLITK
jgi:soluble lytic murein transglycosylase-like protein